MRSRSERLRELAYKSFQTGTDHRWVACLACNHLVKYSRMGETENLAKDLSVSADYISTLARAGDTYAKLRPYMHDMRQVRKALTYSHFAVLGVCMDKYEIPVRDAVEQLRTAALESASVRDLRSALDGEYNDAYTPPWLKKLQTARRACQWLVDHAADYDAVVPGILEASSNYLERTKEYDRNTDD